MSENKDKMVQALTQALQIMGIKSANNEFAEMILCVIDRLNKKDGDFSIKDAEEIDTIIHDKYCLACKLGLGHDADADKAPELPPILKAFLENLKEKIGAKLEFAGAIDMSEKLREPSAENKSLFEQLKAKKAEWKAISSKDGDLSKEDFARIDKLIDEIGELEIQLNHNNSSHGKA